ncbi:hypothetical protein BDF14DRAFT_328684 [Spinellus fusiger]|nr:hypothetical protein BDF14DRAFT_328684 [Spinellus fusiger]
MFHKDLSFRGNSVLMLRPSLSAVFFVTRFAAAPWSATAFTLFPPISAYGSVTQCMDLSLIFVQCLLQLVFGMFLFNIRDPMTRGEGL